MKFSKENISGFLKFLGNDENNIYSKKLLKKALKYSFLFQFIPGILFVGIGNSVAMKTSHENSDIDLFIITKQNRIWTSRILITFLFAILLQRKTKKNHKGKFCLSFFVTEENLNFENIKIENDIYLANWIYTLEKIYDKSNFFEEFKIKNQGFFDFKISENGNKFNNLNSKNIGILGKIFEKIGNFSESLLKKIFLPKTLKSYEKLGKPFGVIISDDILKFHDKDKRIYFRDKYFAGKGKF